MTKFIVKTTSKDGHKFEYSVGAKDEFEAAQKAYQYIEEKGWGDYNYMVDEVIDPNKVVIIQH